MAEFSSRRIYGALLAGQAGLLVVGGRIAESYIQIDCPIRSLTGWQCPGCGSTRCVSALGVGDIAAGFRHNPLLTAAVGASLVFSLIGLISPPQARRLFVRAGTQQRILAVLLLAVVIVFTVARNIS